MNNELLRIVDTLHRDKDIDKEIIFQGIEQALISALHKHLDIDEEDNDDVSIKIDRQTGEIRCNKLGPADLSRIAAQTAKQVILQKIREAERDVIHDDYTLKVGQLVAGTVQRFVGPNIIVNLDKTEGILPIGEQIRSEKYYPGDRVKCLLIDVQKVGQRVKLTLSRTHPDLVQRLFEMEVPEIQEKVVSIKGLVREAGIRTKIAVVSANTKVDCVGACVGVRGTRIKNIVDELNNEKIDIVRWNENLEVFIMHALKPADVASLELDNERQRAIVLVPQDKLSLAIGRKGQNVRLAARLTGWDIDILTMEILEEREKLCNEEVSLVPNVDETMRENLFEYGFFSFETLSRASIEKLSQVEGIDEDLAGAIIDFATEKQEAKCKVVEEAAAAAAAEKSNETTQEV